MQGEKTTSEWVKIIANETTDKGLSTCASSFNNSMLEKQTTQSKSGEQT